MNKIPHRCRFCAPRNPFIHRYIWPCWIPVIAGLITLALTGNYWALAGYAPWLACIFLSFRWTHIHPYSQEGVTWAAPGSFHEAQMLSRVNWWERPL